jgi:hypothetical protein
MSRSKLTPDEIRHRLINQLATLDDPIDVAALRVTGTGPNWKAVLVAPGRRLDEAQLAALYEARRRLAADVDLDPSGA